MKFFVIALILVIDGVIGNPQAGASAGGGGGPSAIAPAPVQVYPSKLQFVKRIQTQPFEESDYMRVVGTEQDSTVLYKKMVDMSTSPTCEGTMSLNGTVIYTIDRKKPAIVCGGNKQGSWEDVVAHMFLAGFTPNQSCPVAPGTYPALQIMPPSTVYFSEIPLCGYYRFFGTCDDINGVRITKWQVLFDIFEYLGLRCVFSR